MRVLLIEDDKIISRVVLKACKDESIEVDVADTGKKAIEKIKDNPEFYNAVILDLILPDLDGIEVCRETRKITNTPILVLSIKSELNTKVEILNIGADDYVTKPFEVKEIIARLNALSRRVNTNNPLSSIKFRELEIFPESFELRINDRLIYLTKTEFKLLHLFMKNPGKLITRDSILNEIWGYSGNDIFSNAIDVHIKDLRRKLGKYKKILQTVRGSGYKFKKF